MNVIKEIKYIELQMYHADWVCPDCGSKNTQRNILANRWKCFRCKKYFIHKRERK